MCHLMGHPARPPERTAPGPTPLRHGATGFVGSVIHSLQEPG